MVGNNDQTNIENINSEIGQPNFLFKRTKDAASRNIKILLAFNGNLGELIRAQKIFPLNYG